MKEPTRAVVPVLAVVHVCSTIITVRGQVEEPFVRIRNGEMFPLL